MFKSILSSLIISQMILAPVAFAQTKGAFKTQPTAKTAKAQPAIDPAQFNWAGDTETIVTPGGTTVPAANPLLWGEVPNDPWGTKDDPANDLGNGGLNTGAGNWEPDLGDLNSGASVDNTDDIVSYFFIGSGILSRNYSKVISDLREANSYLNDFELANKIISEASTSAGAIGAGTASLGTIIQYINLKLASTSPYVAAGAGIATFLGQEGIDFWMVTKIQSTMILKLAALFGELPEDKQGRLELIYNSYVFSAAVGGVISGSSAYVSNKIFATLGGKVAEKTVQETGEKIVEQAVAKEVGAQVAKQVLAKRGFKTFLASLVANNETKKLIGGVAGGAVAAGLSFGVNKIATHYMGNDAHESFYAAQQSRKAKAIAYVRALPRARGTLWLLLTRDVFKRIPNPVDQKKFAQIVSSEIPLVKTKSFSEATQLMADFRDDPTLIEKNLGKLSKELNTEAKLYFMKLIMAGMFMKGSLSKDDYKTLDDAANLLGLQPPESVTVNPQDVRREGISRYRTLVAEMSSQVTATLRVMEKIEKGEKVNDPKVLENAKNAQVWGPGGRIILEDFEDASHDIIELQEQSILNEKTGKDNTQIKKEIIKKQTEKINKNLEKDASKK